MCVSVCVGVCIGMYVYMVVYMGGCTCIHGHLCVSLQVSNCPNSIQCPNNNTSITECVGQFGRFVGFKHNTLGELRQP